MVLLLRRLLRQQLSQRLEGPAERGQVAPNFRGDDALGVIYAVSRDPERHFDENDMVVTRTMANVAAALIKVNLADGKRE